MDKFKFFVAGSSEKRTAPLSHVNALLLPVPTVEKGGKAIRNFLGMLNLEYLFLDSGGFQLLVAENEHLERIDAARKAKRYFNPNRPFFTMERDLPIDNAKVLNITPLHVVKTACEVKPDLMTALDFPVRKFSKKDEQEREFTKKLGYNVRWAVETAELREGYCPDVKLLIPVQAYNISQCKLFLDAIGTIKYDGLSLPVRNLSVSEQAQFFALFYELGVKNIHVLGATSFRQIAFSAYLARHYFDWVSVDSQSWRQCAQYQQYQNNHDLSNEAVNNDVEFPDDTETDCRCPWCRGKNFVDIRDMDYTDRVNFLARHNLWVTKNVAQSLYDEANDFWNFRNALLKRTKNKDRVDDICQGIIEFERLINKGTIGHQHNRQVVSSATI